VTRSQENRVPPGPRIGVEAKPGASAGQEAEKALSLSSQLHSVEACECSDAVTMAARTRTALRGWTPVQMQREVERLSDINEPWASMLVMDRAWRSRANS